MSRDSALLTPKRVTPGLESVSIAGLSAQKTVFGAITPGMDVPWGNSVGASVSRTRMGLLRRSHRNRVIPAGQSQLIQQRTHATSLGVLRACVVHPPNASACVQDAFGISWPLETPAGISIPSNASVCVALAFRLRPCAQSNPAGVRT